MDDMPEPVPRRLPTVPHVPASTFHPSPTTLFRLSASDNTKLGLSDAPAILLIMKAQETVAFIGTCRLLVCRGTVDLLGTTLSASASSHPIFAPKSHAAPVLTAMPNSHGSSKAIALPQELEQRCASADAVIVLQELRSGVEGLGRVVAPFEGVFAESSCDDWGIAGFYPITSDMYNLQAFSLPTSWARATNDFVPNEKDPLEEKLGSRIALVRGMKNSGKSTFARALLNQLTTRYERVAFLECDVGQSEFTPPGLVSLHILTSPVFGPPFTHLIQPYRAHYVGSSSPRSDPSYYLNTIEALLQTFRLDIQFIPPYLDSTAAPDHSDKRIADVVPLVINTMGWTKGLGARLMQQVEDLATPTHVFEFADTDGTGHPLDTFQPSSSAGRSSDHQVYTLEPVPPSSRLAQYSAPLLRALSTMSYLHSAHVSTDQETTQWDVTLPLCAMLPWEVDHKVAFDQIVLVGPGAEDVVPSEIGTVLNGALVAFVALDESGERSAGHTTHVLPYEQGKAPPSPFASTCLGLGVIRSFNPAAGTMHILTPLPASQLAKCRVLIKGELELPIWGFLDHRQTDDEGTKGVAGFDWGKVPYLDWGGVRGIGGDRTRVRRNLMRRSHM
ncbi:hypothetical protein CALVIDRAFT_518471 [Calocera viscosa TUFC12733]|uniref:Polynucleotide 5'-hydroxyl-kinase GRC3 n=1 Tax=Calocera viscosa (strain TUFC12733) TaxID=1330018 RepID=A0A167JPT6_CALVF|nr:hypothetical protein CALVIDRAFT_518471 [Calocera viscosa TUFC12733]